MRLVDWQGPAAPTFLQDLLAREKLTISRGGGGPLIVFSRRGGPPAVPAGRPWIWVSQEAIEEAAAVKAALRGAYAAISLTSPVAASQCIDRLRELLTPEPVL